jgi:hypothetical protein
MRNTTESWQERIHGKQSDEEIKHAPGSTFHTQCAHDELVLLHEQLNQQARQVASAIMVLRDLGAKDLPF